MGKLSAQLKSCDWLGEGRRELYASLDAIEKWIEGHKRPPRPQLELMLACLTKLSKVPDLIIVGQDPYPDMKATGVAFQTKDNLWSSSLDTIAHNLGLPTGHYPDLDHWVADQGVLMLNAALCNFGRCDKAELFARWRGFVCSIIELIISLNPNVVIMLLGKKRVWHLLPKMHNVVRCRHPSHGWGPTVCDWEKVEALLRARGVDVDLRTHTVPVESSKYHNR